MRYAILTLQKCEMTCITTYRFCKELNNILQKQMSYRFRFTNKYDSFVFPNLAHAHITRLKNDIQHHASGQQLSTDMIDSIRVKIAHALYTLQNFYSNTNWIEMHNPNITVYEDFGKNFKWTCIWNIYLITLKTFIFILMIKHTIKRTTSRFLPTAIMF